MSKYRQVAKILRSNFPSPPRFGPLGNMPYLLKKKKAAGTITGASPTYYEEFGDTILIELGPLPIVSSRDLDFLRLLISHDLHQVVKPKWDLAVKDAFLKSIIWKDGEPWYKSRNLLRNAFKKKALESYIPQIYLSAIELGEVLQSNYELNGGTDTDILAYYKRLLMDIIARIGFGYEFQSLRFPGKNKVAENFYTIIEIGGAQITNPFYQIIGPRLFKEWTPAGKRFNAALASMRSELIEKVITPRLAKFHSDPTKRTGGSDILHYILESTGQENWELDEEEVKTLTQSQLADAKNRMMGSIGSHGSQERYTNEELIDEVGLFFAAGGDTTSSLLAWATYYISKYPEIKTKILEELKENGFYDLKDRENSPTFSMVNRLSYLSQVLKEVLRLHPVAQIYGRETETELKFKNFTIPPGTLLQGNIYAIHRDPRHWKAPTEFNPERFNPENTAQRDPLAWIPFGAGIRNCIGMQLALMQSRIVLAYLLPRFEFITTSEPKVIEIVNLSLANLKQTVRPIKMEG